MGWTASPRMTKSTKLEGRTSKPLSNPDEMGGA